MKLYVVIFLANLFMFGLGNSMAVPGKTLVEYDSFIFVLQWPSKPLLTKPISIDNICGLRDPPCNASLARIKKNSMTIRGLLPSFTSGVFVKDNTLRTSVIVEPEGLTNYHELRQVWPSLTSTSELSLWSQVYNKYGHYYVHRNGRTNYSFYFETAVAIFNMYRYETLFQRAFGSESGERLYSANELDSKIAAAIGHPHFKMLCQRIHGQHRITELYVSLGLSFEPLPAKITGIECPTNVPIIVKFI